MVELKNPDWLAVPSIAPELWLKVNPAGKLETAIEFAKVVLIGTVSAWPLIQ